MTDLAAKARRAAEWLSNSDLIAFAEDCGWQDQEQEPDGVEWETKREAASYGELVLVVEKGEDHWDWKVQEIFGDVLYPAQGTAPTRAEARRQAVEAARGMG